MADLFDLLDARPVCGQVESWAYAQGYELLIGLDEAGRGPLAGPVVAAAVALPRACTIAGINDSKALSERKREALYPEIVEGAIAHAVCVVDAEEIDSLNILQASMAAMARAHGAVLLQHPELGDALALVDGNRRAPLAGGVEQRPVVKGDARSLNIAAASILAKVTRDRLMVEYDKRWPAYGFAKHKGYPTAAHREAIRIHGPCDIHRKSFRLLAEPT